MRHIIISLALLLLTNGAWAEWEMVSRVAGGDHYIDRSTIRKDANFRKVWSILNLHQRYPDGEMSRRVRYEFDCSAERARILSMSTHSQPMAEGRILGTWREDPGGWSDAPPGTAFETILKIVCTN